MASTFNILSFQSVCMQTYTGLHNYRFESVFVTSRVYDGTLYLLRQEETNYILCKCKGTNMLQDLLSIHGRVQNFPA